MTRYATLFDWLDRELGAVLMPTLARLVFAGTLLVYYVRSGLGKLGEGAAGLFNPEPGAYIQILPRVFDAAGYDPSAIGPIGQFVVLAGTWTEIVLPVLVVAGLFTRPAALAMIGFILVQSWVDVMGHGVDAATVGTWFDRASGGLIADQRAYWCLGLLILVVRGAGPISLDALLFRRRDPA
ncbi:DoxX family membrane protein [Rhodobacterales bacterium HKCCE2091]|nr:DoxX family membrane protein [Rhodobacterales bacterium HKCCE2091]